MLPRASAPTTTDDITALEDVSTDTGSRYIKSRVTLLEIGSQRYEACGVNTDKPHQCFQFSNQCINQYTIYNKDVWIYQYDDGDDE